MDIQCRQDTYGHISSTSIKQSPITMLQNFFGVVANAVEVVGSIVVMTFLGLYFADEANLYISGLVRLVPRGHRGRGAEILRDRERDLVVDAGSLLSMTTLGFLVAIGLWMIGVPLPVALGFWQVF